MRVPLVPALLDTLLGRRELAHRPWSAVWTNYDLRQGRLWPLGLLSLLLGPVLCAR